MPHRRDDVVMLFLGGAHQLLHLAPVAAQLSRLQPGRKVTCIASNRRVAELIEDIRRELDAPALCIETIEPPLWWRKLGSLVGSRKSSKTALLLKLLPRLAGVGTIVTPERTSALLRTWHLTRARMIHFRHGAGDRAPSSEDRLSAFDLIVVPGRKDVERAINEQHIEPGRLRTGGYIKLDYLLHMSRIDTKLFGNDRPVILYNPHFDPTISSWRSARAVIDRILADGRYNLVFAPHIRLAERLTAEQRTYWEALAETDRLIVDLASDRLLDMSYVRAADIYLGDMSSQLYEFLATPRPVAFVNAHRVDWRRDPRYAGWHLGEVADHPDELIRAIDRAIERHPGKIARQKAAVRRAFGKVDGACARSAAILAEAIDAPLPG